MCNFRVGQKVVCVKDNNFDDQPIRSWGESDPPVVGAIYTVTRVFINPDERVALEFAEISRSKSYREQGYRAARFRPVAERKTDISIFKAMLNPSKEGVQA